MSVSLSSSSPVSSCSLVVGSSQLRSGPDRWEKLPSPSNERSARRNDVQKGQRARQVQRPPRHAKSRTHSKQHTPRITRAAPLLLTWSSLRLAFLDRRSGVQTGRNSHRQRCQEHAGGWQAHARSTVRRLAGLGVWQAGATARRRRQKRATYVWCPLEQELGMARSTTPPPWPDLHGANNERRPQMKGKKARSGRGAWHAELATQRTEGLANGRGGQWKKAHDCKKRSSVALRKTGSSGCRCQVPPRVRSSQALVYPGRGAKGRG